MKLATLLKVTLLWVSFTFFKLSIVPNYAKHMSSETTVSLRNESLKVLFQVNPWLFSGFSIGKVSIITP